MEPYQVLEQEFGCWLQVDNVVACSSGTAALHLALEALELKPGSEVIVPDFAMIACARAVTLAGLTPVFADCTPSLLVDPAYVKKAVGPKTGAIMAVHTYGRRCDMDTLARVAANNCLHLIEDLAEAHGIRPHSESSAATWSFYRNKIVAGQEGGAVAFRQANHAAKARSLRCLGFTEAHDFNHVPRGHNYRLANVLATLILQSLRQVDHNLHARREIESWYDRCCPVPWKLPPRDAVWVYDLRIPGMTRAIQDRIVAALSEVGIQARHAFKPMHEQLEFTRCTAVGPDRHWGACMAAKEVIYLPVQPGITTPKSCELAIREISRVLR